VDWSCNKIKQFKILKNMTNLKLNKLVNSAHKLNKLDVKTVVIA